MDYGMFEEALVDFFCRQHHDPEVARSRARAIVLIAKGCDEELVGGDRGLEIVLHCSEIIPIAPYIEAARDPYAAHDEGYLAVETLKKFLAERGRKKPEPPKRVPYEIRLPFGGGWLLEVRQEREVQRREAYRLKRRNAARPPKRRAPEVGLEGTAGAVSGQRDGVPFSATAQAGDLAVQASSRTMALAVRPGSRLHERLPQSTRPRDRPPTRVLATAGPQPALEGQAAQVQQGTQ
jgi:hypothetical protein